MKILFTNLSGDELNYALAEYCIKKHGLNLKEHGGISTRMWFGAQDANGFAEITQCRVEVKYEESMKDL